MAARMWRPNWVRTIPGWTAKELILHPHCSECNNYLMQTIVSFVEASSKQYICKLALSICRPEILIECSNTNRRNTKHRSSASASDHQNVFFLLLEPSCQMPCEKSLQDVVIRVGLTYDETFTIRLGADSLSRRIRQFVKAKCPDLSSEKH